MKLSDWRLIYELHKTPNMTRVAGILYITQSAVTKQLQHIEKELDSKLVKTPLFMKDGNPVSRNTWLIWRMEKKISPAMESFLRYIRKNCQISQ